MQLNKLDLNGIPNRKVQYNFGDSAFLLGNEQEDFTVERLRIAYPNYYWFTTRDFFGELNTESDRIHGDIIGIRKGELKPCIFIDLKVAKYDADSYNRLGTVSLNSILGFAKNKNHGYLSVNKDGSFHLFKHGYEIFDIFNKGKCLYVADKKRIERPDLNYLLPKYLKNPPKNVSVSDYMPSFMFYYKP
ncbi:MAG: hypothetical protein IJH39_11090 [Clostridia bacterium]|nr:hypothetical protein [Clostridia bacterium]